jgi:hypothetical protein
MKKSEGVVCKTGNFLLPSNIWPFYGKIQILPYVSLFILSEVRKHKYKTIISANLNFMSPQYAINEAPIY